MKDNNTIMGLITAARRGFISDDELIEAYIENIEIVLPYVQKINDAIDGKTIVTADHGELLGESVYPLGRNLYGHPGNVAALPLREVPWIELDHQSRRTIQAGDPIKSDHATIEEKENHLEALGYI